MGHDQLINLEWKFERDPPPFEGNDIKFPENFARHIIKKYSKQGDIILDPFAGLGTTLFVAEELKRIPYGFEAENQKHEWVAGQLENWTHHIYDDTARLDKYKLPKIDLVFTSPPFMPRHHKWNPLFGGNPKKAGYEKYLKRMGFIFGKIKTVMKQNAPLIIQVDNLQHGKIFTPLIRDIANIIDKDFIQTGETIVKWENAKDDYPYTSVLIFKKRVIK